MNSLIKLKYFSIGLVALSTASLLGCTQKPKPPTPEQIAQTQQQERLAMIRQAHVQVIQQGSRLQMRLPTDKFFQLQTSQLKETKIPTMRLIALYLHAYARHHVTNYPIKIYGYTDKVYSRSARQNLSNQYSQVVAAFMWNHGFSPSQMKVVGYSAKNSIGSNRTIDGSAFNRRVMIQVN